MAKHVAITESSQTMETAKSRVHVFRGQDLAELPLQWLNRTDRPEDDPIEQLVRLELERSRESREFLPGSLGSMELDRTAQIILLVNQTQEKWNPGQYRAAVLDGQNWIVRFRLRAMSPEPMGLLVLDKCLLLKEEGLLDRLRECARPGCGEWFFAKFDHQKCHSDDCRVAILSADEARKEERKKYMRRHRRIKKLRKKKKGGQS